ncbi:MAG TPA: phosphonate C-P lyase system protein PhnH [Vicinamibacterales bacterium]|nr:phosphonate C-P lyase system protein PhnH [Vicinamibacterales bacterium]
MAHELSYDPILHSQRHFRSLLDSMSRPGTINELSAVDLTPPPGLNRASVLVAFALLNADVQFHLVGMTEQEAAYLTTNTGSSHATEVAGAAFVFTAGHEPPALLEEINCGTLTYPDTAATIVIQVEAMAQEPSADGLILTLQGPGIDGRTSVWVRGLSPDLLLALQARNAEFPLGIDALVTCDGGGEGSARVLGIPRTCQVTWEVC